MAAGIDMSLDDIIKKSSAAASRRRSYGPGPERRRSYGPGPERRLAVRNPTRTTPYSIPQHAKQAWRGGMVQGMALDNGAAAETGTKLYISNLHYEVSNDDIMLLFSEEGELKRSSIHYDRSGRSKGTAEVVYARRSDALAAIKKYNNMRLDGKPLQIELVGTSFVTPAVMPHCQNSLLGRPKDVLVSEQGKFGGSRFQNSFARGHIPRGRGEEKDVRKESFKDLDHDMEGYHHRARGHREMKGHIRKVSVKDLDEDLERYHLEAMKINKENGK